MVRKPLTLLGFFNSYTGTVSVQIFLPLKCISCYNIFDLKGLNTCRPTIERICRVLNCDVDDILEFVPVEEEKANG